MPHPTPDNLTPTQGRQEIAAILGRGLLRLIGARGNQPARPDPPTRKPLMCPRPATLVASRKKCPPLPQKVCDKSPPSGPHTVPKKEVTSCHSGKPPRARNLSQLAGPFELSRPAIGEYVTLLEGVFLVNRIQPWFSNKLRRLIKTPKIHLGDIGLGCALMGMGSKDLMEDRKIFGRLLETFVFQELQRQASWQEAAFRFSHFRQKDGAEVDIVRERGPRDIVGVEVKLSVTVGGKDFNGLRKLQEATGSRFKTGIILYDGENGLRFGENLYALPIWTLWSSR